MRLFGVPLLTLAVGCSPAWELSQPEFGEDADAALPDVWGSGQLATNSDMTLSTSADVPR
jgi:hypothetical protein